jgi:hypothetical protein
MNKEQIVSCITELSHSQGFYSRILEVLDDELLTKLENQNFNGPIDLIFYLES